MRRLLRISAGMLLNAATLTAYAQTAGTNAITATVTEVDFAAAGQTQTNPALINWQPYDTFAATSLNTTLWQIGNQQGSIATGAGGLVIAPTTLASAGLSSSVAIQTPVPVPLGQYFAVRVPFAVSNASASLPGGAEFNFDICGVNLHGQCDSTGWVLGNHVVPPGGGAALTGSYWFAGTGPLATLTAAAGSSQSGQLAVVYSGGALTSWINDGSGWQTLGTPFTPPASWEPAGGPFTFSLGSSITTTVPAVPEPATSTLLGLGLALLMLCRRALRRAR